MVFLLNQKKLKQISYKHNSNNMQKLLNWFESKFPTDQDKLNFLTHTTFIFGCLSWLGYIILFK